MPEQSKFHTTAMDWREEEEGDCNLSDDEQQGPCDNFLVFLGTGTSCGVPKMSCVARNALIRRAGKRQCSTAGRLTPVRRSVSDPRAPPSERGGSCPNLAQVVANVQPGAIGSSSDEDSEECEEEFFCTVCESARNPMSKNRRRNTSMLIHYQGRNIVIDCGKLFYDSALQWFPEYGIDRLDAVILTHDHNDATGGLDDLRDFTAFQNESIPVYANKRTMQKLALTHFYLVNKRKASGLFTAQLDFKELEDDCSSFSVCGLPFQPLDVLHGPSYHSWGFRFGDVVYISDVSSIPDTTYPLINNCALLILDAQQWDGTLKCHLTVVRAIEEVRKIRPERTLLVDMNHLLDHEEVNRYLRTQYSDLNVQLAYDGQQISSKGLF